MRSLALARPGTVVLVASAKRAVRSGAVWGLLFGVMVANEALGYHRNFPTAASRESFARSFGSNGGLTAMTGPGRQLDTLQGFVAWRMFGLMIVVGAVWGLLTATRLLRAEEDAGRWDVFVAGRTSRRGATTQALLALGAGYIAMWLVSAVLFAAGGLRATDVVSLAGWLYYAAAGTASAAIFLAVGALCSQLATSRRQANTFGAAVLGLAYVLRMVADSRTDLGWLRWTSPLGWVENLAPLTTPRPVAFLPIVLLVAATAGAAVVLSGRRDVGDGAWARADRVRRAHRPIRGPVALTARLERGVAAAWIGGLALLAAVFGAAARAAAGGGLGNKSIGQVVGRAGTGAPAATWLGYELLYVSAILAFAAAAQISATRADEADGLVDNLLVRPLTRRRWLLTRIGLAAVAVFVAGVASGVGGWLGVGGGKGLGLGRMLQAGVSIAVPGLVVLGLGTLVYGLLPRLAAPVLYAFVLWSFVVSVIGATITTSRWLLDTSLLTHLGAVPATEPRWGVVLTMLGICVVAASLGVVAFERRDLAGD